MIGIYMFEDKDNHKKYVGQSINIIKRKWEHINNPSPYSYFDKVLLEKGTDGFDFIILEECPVQQLDEREIYWIEYYDSINNGYNLIKGGNCYRGENNVWAKLNDNQVLQIIKLLEECKLTNKAIAKLFNVSQGTIDLINRCKIWNHLHLYKNNIRQEYLNKMNVSRSPNNGEIWCAKITEKEALEIIDLLKNDKRSLAQISRDLNISLNIIYDINRCKTWKYLHNYKKNVRNEARKEMMPI